MYSTAPLRSLRGSRILALCVSALVLTSVHAAPADSASRWDWPGMKKCGTFKAEYVIHVYAKRVSCRKARKIQREYWLAPDSRKVRHNGGSGANGWVTLKRFPGWSCGSGAGAGMCSKGKRKAAYMN